MSKHILLFLFYVNLSLPATLYGQVYEAGVYGGMSAYRGDLNQEKLFNQVHPTGGLMIRYNQNQHVSARLNTGYTILRGNDLRGDNPYIIFPGGRREYSFETTLLELSLQAEVNFLPFTAGDTDTRFTPYIFGGGGGIYFDPEVYQNNLTPTAGYLDPARGNNKEKFAAIGLVGFGFKLNVIRDIVVDASWGFRFSNTDYLDEVSLRGNPKDNDYYSILSLTVTYKFLDRSRPECPMHHF